MTTTRLPSPTQYALGAAYARNRCSGIPTPEIMSAIHQAHLTVRTASAPDFHFGYIDALADMVAARAREVPLGDFLPEF